MTGSVEAACGLGLADAIVDLVETGTTMRVSIIRLLFVSDVHVLFFFPFIASTCVQAARLEAVADVMTSEAYLIASKQSRHPVLVELIRKRILGYMTAYRFVIVFHGLFDL